MPQLDNIMIVVQSHILLFFIVGYLLFLSKVAPIIILTLKYRKLLVLKCIKESYSIKKKYTFMNIFFEIRLLYLIKLNNSYFSYKSLLKKKMAYNIL
jgi:hypothetical protein